MTLSVDLKHNKNYFVEAGHIRMKAEITGGQTVYRHI